MSGPHNGEIFNSPLTAGNDNGTTSTDGSHLTGDGPGFIAKMKMEGIVCSSLGGDATYDCVDK